MKRKLDGGYDEGIPEIGEDDVRHGYLENGK